MYYVYILKQMDKKHFYVGYTKDLEDRLVVSRKVCNFIVNSLKIKLSFPIVFQIVP